MYVKENKEFIKIIKIINIMIILLINEATRSPRHFIPAVVQTSKY